MPLDPQVKSVLKNAATTISKEYRSKFFEFLTTFAMGDAAWLNGLIILLTNGVRIVDKEMNTLGSYNFQMQL